MVGSSFGARVTLDNTIETVNGCIDHTNTKFDHIRTDMRAQDETLGNIIGTHHRHAANIEGMQTKLSALVDAVTEIADRVYERQPNVSPAAPPSIPAADVGPGQQGPRQDGSGAAGIRSGGDFVNQSEFRRRLKSELNVKAKLNAPTAACKPVPLHDD